MSGEATNYDETEVQKMINGEPNIYEGDNEGDYIETGDYILFPIATYKSQTYRNLKHATKNAFMAMLTEYNDSPAENPDHDLEITQRQIAGLSGCSTVTVSGAIKELVKSGFIEVTEQGGLTRKRSRYRVNAQWIY